MVVPHPIQQNKVEKTSGGNVVGLIKRRIALIQHRPQLLTLIPTSHVSITTYMGMMPIIASHFN
jgi:hypothetical protein